MVLSLKKRARPTTEAPNDEPDPVGFGTTLAEMIAELQRAYRARLHAFLRKFLLLQLAPAARRQVFAAVAAQGRPVTFDFKITLHPPDASGFCRAVGVLKMPSGEVDEDQLDEQPDAAERGPYVNSIFGEKIPASRLKTKRRRFGRRG
jgi:hypothetical protein